MIELHLTCECGARHAMHLSSDNPPPRRELGMPDRDELLADLREIRGLLPDFLDGQELAGYELPAAVRLCTQHLLADLREIRGLLPEYLDGQELAGYELPAAVRMYTQHLRDKAFGAGRAAAERVRAASAQEKADLVQHFRAREVFFKAKIGYLADRIPSHIVQDADDHAHAVVEELRKSGRKLPENGEINVRIVPDPEDEEPTDG